MYLVISLLVLRAGYGIWLYQFLIIAYLFTSYRSSSWARRNALRRFHYFFLIPWTLFSCVHFPCYFHVGLFQTMSKSRRQTFWHCDVNVVYEVSGHVGTDTDSDTGSDNGSDTDISLQNEMSAKEAICKGLSTESWPYHTEHIVTYRFINTIDQW